VAQGAVHLQGNRLPAEGVHRSDRAGPRSGITRTQPIHYAVERAKQNETSSDEEYLSTATSVYSHNGWKAQSASASGHTRFSDPVKVFSAAGLWLEIAIEPQLSEDARRRDPHNQAWMNKCLCISMFKIRPQPGQ
jgi:hypothetical protein